MSDVSENAARTLAAGLLACLDDEAPDRALLKAYGGWTETFTELADGHDREGYKKPPAIVGVAALCILQALRRAGRHADMAPFLLDLGDRFSAVYRYQRRDEPMRALLGHFMFLHIPFIEDHLERGLQQGTVDWILAFNPRRRAEWRDASLDDALVAEILSHPAAGGFSPFVYDPAWVVGQQEKVMSLGLMDDRLESVRKFESLFLQNALDAQIPDHALPLINEKIDRYLGCPIRDRQHFMFNAVCVLAAIGDHDRALGLAKALVRQGYRLKFRFFVDPTKDDVWNRETRQHEWLADLSKTASYQMFLDGLKIDAVSDTDPDQTTFAFLQTGTYSGKAKKRCELTKTLIEPGAEVVRIRRLFGERVEQEIRLAAATAFERGGWARRKREFDENEVPLTHIFSRHHSHDWDSPSIAAFAYDVSQEPGSFELGRAVQLVADHQPPPVCRTWYTDRHQRHQEDFQAFEGAGGYGDAVNLTWRLVKAGHAEAFMQLARKLPAEKADKVFAMLGTFALPAFRAGAQSHFDLEELPDIMALVFKGRLTVEDHLRVADFGHENPRYRAALLTAMHAYGLHLYSNSQPTVDWFLQGLDHFSLAKGCHLLFFFIHHVEEEEILSTMVETGWLPDSAGGGGAGDIYDNSSHFHIRTVLFHLALYHPERVKPWIDRALIQAHCTMSVDRETFRLIDKLLKKRPALDEKSGRRVSRNR